jgi:hypothetical protein
VMVEIDPVHPVQGGGILCLTVSLVNSRISN